MLTDLCRPFLTLILSTSLYGFNARATNVEFIETSKAERLQIAYDHAQPVNQQELDGLDASHWQCDMYGMSSKMQVERNVKLYAFSKDASSQLKNSGAQIIKSYRKDKDVQGMNGSIRDSLRLSSSGELISKLEMLSPESGTTRVLAISQCTRI